MKTSNHTKVKIAHTHTQNNKSFVELTKAGLIAKMVNINGPMSYLMHSVKAKKTSKMKKNNGTTNNGKTNKTITPHKMDITVEIID